MADAGPQGVPPYRGDPLTMYEERTVVIDLWVLPEAQEEFSDIDLTGFEVEARDGHIGTVDEHTRETGGTYIVLKTGPWIFGKRVMLPAGVISRIEPDERKVYVDLTKDEIKNAPEFNEETFRSQGYRDELGAYYGLNRPPGPDLGKDDRPSPSA